MYIYCVYCKACPANTRDWHKHMLVNIPQNTTQKQGKHLRNKTFDDFSTCVSMEISTFLSFSHLISSQAVV